MSAKQTILYSRLSREDERANESLSIENQKAFLEEYANRNGFTNLVHLSDDGWSGTRWDRPGMSKLLDEVDKGTVSAVLCKDMSRAGRDFLRVELLMEKFREKGVRFIAITDNVDSDSGMDDFTPFRNIINEWVARDTSRKIKAIFGARTANGHHVTGALPYGYIHDPNDRQQWILDETAAPIVRRLFLGIIAGKTLTQLSNELEAEGVLNPSSHWASIGAGMRKYPTIQPTKWTLTTICEILKKEEYMGKKILNKTTKESYKTKKRNPNPDGRLVFEGAIPSIVTVEEWTVVQRLRNTRRRPQRITGAPNPLTGVLYCADCGKKMFHKQGDHDKHHKPHDEYVCSSYRHHSAERKCTCHYIRVEVVQELILDTIRRVSAYALNNEAEFLERLRHESVLQQESAVKENKKKLAKAKRRREEITELVRKLYEAYATGKIPEKHFDGLLKNYDTEQNALDSELEKLQADINTFTADSVRADRFMELAKRYTEFPVLSPLLLNEFIEKVVVHEADKSTGKRVQKVDIHLNFIGNFELPAEAVEELPTSLSRGRKPRRLMTPEELEHEREIDRKAYAKKRAARIAKEEAERAEILAGTSFEKAGNATDDISAAV